MLPKDFSAHDMQFCFLQLVLADSHIAFILGITEWIPYLYYQRNPK